MPQCKFCKKEVPTGTRHHCQQLQQAGHSEQVASNDNDFFLSMAVAAATDSALLGFAVGGNIGGALLGDMLNSDSSEVDSTPAPAPDYSGGGGDFGGGGSSSE